RAALGLLLLGGGAGPREPPSSCASWYRRRPVAALALCPVRGVLESPFPAPSALSALLASCRSSLCGSGFQCDSRDRRVTAGSYARMRYTPHVATRLRPA